MQNRAAFIFWLLIFSSAALKLRAQCASGNPSQTINLQCGVSCTNLSFTIPDLREPSDYLPISIPYNPYPFQDTRVGGMTFASPPQWPGNSYSAVQTLPFNFCFYDSVCTRFVIGSNGCISFDTSNALKWCELRIWVNNASKRLPNSWYAKGLIAGVLQDLDPFDTTRTVTGEKVEYRIEGVAPCRRAVISYYNIPLWPGSIAPYDCYTKVQTYQIVLHEGSGIIDVFEQDKPPCNGSNNGLAILGLQNWGPPGNGPDKWSTPPNRNAFNWGRVGLNEAYRFLPHGGASKFLRAELWEGPRILSVSIDTVRISPSEYSIHFDNVCSAASTNMLLMKSVYGSCDGSGNVVYVDTVFINRSTTLNATIETIPASCGGSNGSIIVHVQLGAGTPPYNYYLDVNPPQRDSVFSGLAAGNYVVQVRDAGGCFNTFNVTLTQSNVLFISNVVDTPSCTVANDGAITVNVLNGNPPFLYSLNGGPQQPSNYFGGLAPGNYSVQAVDAIGCRSPLTSVTVPQGPPLAATVQTTPTSCSGANNGTITVTPTNGSGPYQYSLNGGPSQTSNVFTNLSVGNYTISIVDASGCTLNNLPAQVQAGQPLVPTAVKTDVSCNGGNDGTLTVNVANGTPPYQYSIDGSTFQASNVFNNLTAGNYTITVKDNNGCSGTVSITINQPAALSMNTAVTAVRCNGETNGAVTINAGGGTAPYQYSINGTTYQPGNAFTNLAAGNYSVFVKDSKNCILSQSISVTQPQPLQLTISTQNASCGGGNDGKITVAATGGNLSYQYSLDAVNYQASNIFNVAPGNYTVTVQDNKGCQASQSNITVGLDNTLRITAINDTNICQGKSVGLNAVSNATQYNWLPATGLSNATIANPVFTAATPGLYTYVVNAVLGPCNGSDTVRINVWPAPSAYAGADVKICKGDSVQLNGSGGTGFNWSPAATLSNTTIANPFAKPSSTTIYNLMVTDANGCSSLQADDVKVEVIPPFNVNITPDSYVTPGDVIQLHAEGGVSYLWSPPVGLNDPTLSDPLATITRDITYYVVVTTAEGCKSQDSVTIKAFKGPDIYVPTAFTPNYDGQNDVFTPIPVGIKKIEYFHIFDRWGNLVFSTTELRKGWDGKYKQLDANSGVYVWVVKAVADNGKIISKKGTVTLIR